MDRYVVLKFPANYTERNRETVLNDTYAEGYEVMAIVSSTRGAQWVYMQLREEYR